MEINKYPLVPVLRYISVHLLTSSRPLYRPPPLGGPIQIRPFFRCFFSYITSPPDLVRPKDEGLRWELGCPPKGGSPVV